MSDRADFFAHHLPELLVGIAFARHRRGPAKALRTVERIAKIEGDHP